MENNLRLIIFENCKEFGKLVDKHLQEITKEKKSFIIPIDEVRFNNGEGKIVINETVRKKEIFLLSDIGNHSITYKMFGYINHKSPDDHFQDVLRALCAIRDQAHSTSLVMPLMYSSRQHKREGRESLDCAVALQTLINKGIKNIITFDVHDSNVQNAIPCSSFDNFYPTNIILEQFVENEKLDNDKLLAIAPDSGAIKRTNYYANMLGCEFGGHFEKQRDLYRVVDGKNPILKHEYIGKDVKNKDIIIVDDMIASGESMIDVARELKKRGAKQIFMMSAYSLFTKGIEVLQDAYDEGLFTRLYTTNLSYVPQEALDKEWVRQVDCSDYVAKIIYTFYLGKSVSPILAYKSKKLEDFAKH